MRACIVLIVSGDLRLDALCFICCDLTLHTRWTVVVVWGSTNLSCSLEHLASSNAPPSLTCIVCIFVGQWSVGMGCRGCCMRRSVLEGYHRSQLLWRASRLPRCHHLLRTHRATITVSVSCGCMVPPRCIWFFFVGECLH